LQKGKEKSEEDIIQDREKGKKDRNKEKWILIKYVSSKFTTTHWVVQNLTCCKERYTCIHTYIQYIHTCIHNYIYIHNCIYICTYLDKEVFLCLLTSQQTTPISQQPTKPVVIQHNHWLVWLSSSSSLVKLYGKWFKYMYMAIPSIWDWVDRKVKISQVIS
jgi:hypothetical protein